MTEPNFFQNAGDINNSKSFDSFSGNGVSSGGLCGDMTSNTPSPRDHEVPRKKGRQQFQEQEGIELRWDLWMGLP